MFKRLKVMAGGFLVVGGILMAGCSSYDSLASPYSSENVVEETGNQVIEGGRIVESVREGVDSSERSIAIIENGVERQLTAEEMEDMAELFSGSEIHRMREEAE